MNRVETIGDCTLYLGDCRGILPTLEKVDAVVTDPPYPDYHVDRYWAAEVDLHKLLNIGRFQGKHQFIFWSARADFPLDWSAVHIWHKTGSQFCAYERIFEREGQGSYLVFEGNPITNPTMARFGKDEWFGHPSQKPVSLMRTLVSRTSGCVLDPFMGSGTTGVACVNIGRSFIGIEREPSYFDTACRRIEEAYKQPRLFAEPAPKVVQEVLI